MGEKSDIEQDSNIAGRGGRNKGLGEKSDIAREGNIARSVGRNEGLGEICDIDVTSQGGVGRNEGLGEICDIDQDGNIAGSVGRNEGLGEICDIDRDGNIAGSVGRNEGLGYGRGDIGWDGNITMRNGRSNEGVVEIGPDSSITDEYGPFSFIFTAFFDHPIIMHQQS